MSARIGRAPEGLYVTGPRWHLVHGPEINAPDTGPAYLFRCFRWMRVSQVTELGTYRGVPRASDPVCGFCLRFGNDANDDEIPGSGEDLDGM